MQQNIFKVLFALGETSLDLALVSPPRQFQNWSKTGTEWRSFGLLHSIMGTAAKMVWEEWELEVREDRSWTGEGPHESRKLDFSAIEEVMDIMGKVNISKWGIGPSSPKVLRRPGLCTLKKSAVELRVTLLLRQGPG